MLAVSSKAQVLAGRPVLGRLLSWRFSLRQRLTFLLLLASLPGVAVAVMLAINALAVQSRQIETTARHLATLQAAQHTTVVEGARIMLATLIESEALAELDQAECGAFLSDWLDQYPSFASLALVRADGEVLCSSLHSELPLLPAERPWFDQVRESGEFTVGEYTIGRTGTPLIVAAQPVHDRRGRFEGAVAVAIDLRWLEFLARRVELPPDSTVTALAADGSVLVHHVAPRRATDSGETQPAAVPARDLRTEIAALGSGALRGPNETGDPRIYGFHRTDSGGLVIAIGMSPYLEFARYGAALRDTLTAPLTIIVLALAAAWWGAERFVTRWVRSLTRTTRRMAGGDLGARSAVPYGAHEVGELAAAFDGMAATIEDAQRRLQAALENRETLLHELNHRVKNNLQMVISLLNLQASQVAREDTREQLREIANRIHTLASIHQLLFRGDAAPRPPPAEYPQRLCESLGAFYAAHPSVSDMEIEIARVPLSVEQAIPFGLILNELVSNAYKHAFPEGRRGRVRVRLEVEGGGPKPEVVHLNVSDNGVGPPDGFEILESPSTGLKVAQALAERLRGSLGFERRDGWTTFHLRFPREGAPVPI